METLKNGMTSHLEDYLEAILQLSQDSGAARASAVAARVGVTRASVTGALRSLSERGLIVYRPYQPVVLTEEGRKTAQGCADRHQFLYLFFRDQLGMEDSEADSVASRVEHVANSTVVSRLAEFSRFLAECREVDVVWSPGGTLMCSRTPVSDGCEACKRSRPGISD